jgi:cellulose synthase/poly-beta-1,6-N-acetylglucosamine synthase-like glycosyltransferase
MDLNISITKKLSSLLMLVISFAGNIQEVHADSSLSQTFFGNVTDEKTNRSVEELKIEINRVGSDEKFNTKTNKNGRFIFKTIPIGEYKLTILDEDYRKEAFNFEVTEIQPSKLDFRVSKKVSWMFNWGDDYYTEHYWSHFVARIIISIYFTGLVLVLFYSILQLTLAISYVKRKKSKIRPVFDPKTAKKVTIQLPMYNELYVADRIIETCAVFEYPVDKFQIQVLDDSTDETKDVIAKKVSEVKARGINIQHIHRTDRTGYKAGALDDAMDQVEGEFIAIFDADFIPEKDWLQKTMPNFDSDEVGVVQTRWGHINKNYSLLTELQAFGLNGHFAIEQGGRSALGHFINFNGTGGVWRKKCIEDAGGWEHDTLTEDLDLSYRAQIKGWKFRYLEEVIAPAELPITMSALKSQQHRWMKGGAECFIKMWKTMITAKNIKLFDRIHGLSHLFNSSVFIFILMISLFSLPVLHIKDSFTDLNYVIRYGSIFIISTVFLMFYYWHSYRDKTEKKIKSFFPFLGRFFLFLMVSMGLALNNSVAVLEGYLGIKSSFVRTPKFNVNVKNEFKGNKYDKKSLSILNIGEGLLATIFLFTAINRGFYGDLGMVPFHLMLAFGYGLVFYHSVAELRIQKM